MLYNTKTKELNYTPIYYYIGHFSKFIQKGAFRVATIKHDYRLQTAAFQNPDGSLILVVINPTGERLPAIVRHKGICTKAEQEPHSIMTVIL